MKCLSRNLTKIIGIAVAIFSLVYIRKGTSGKTLFISTGIKMDYPFINLENGEVTAYITYKGKTYMHIQYNVLTEETKVKGSIETIKLNRLLRNKIKLDDVEYIEMVQSSARFFIENEITNPEEYYRQD
ncbi:MAG: hypothetical protein RR587_05275 [Solibacillus sp.]